VSGVIFTSVKMKRATEWHVTTALHSPRAWATSLGVRETWILESGRPVVCVVPLTSTCFTSPSR
jgi:hypothetical protein